MEALNKTTFEEIIEEDYETCLVVFSRETCHVCQAVHEKLHRLETEFSDFPFYSIDIEAEPELMNKFHLKGVPHVMYFSNGELVKKLTGNHDEDEYADAIEELQ